MAILTVSETCSHDSSKDLSGPKLRSLFEQNDPPWSIAECAICADAISDIQRFVKHWADVEMVDMIITTGGTGFAQSDVTPEAVRPLLEKQAPGLVHAMFAESFKITPLAAMARLVAGVRGSTLIITVPGSPKGAIENAQAILKLLPHASDLASGKVASRAIHAKGTKYIEEENNLVPKALHTEHTCGHTHSHHHNHANRHTSNDPSLAVTKRARSSPYPMVPVTDALKLILQNTPEPLEVTIPIDQESPNIKDSIVSQDIHSQEAVPAFRASIVDGYAVVASDGPGQYPVVSISHAKPGSLPQLKPGQITRITTGAPLPSGADSVVMVEDTKLISSTDDGKEEKLVEIMLAPKKNDNIREIGSDVQKGSLIMTKGERITGTGGEIGILASAGLQNIPVYRKPVIGVLSTGDELVDPINPKSLETGEIRDTNRLSLLTAIRAWNYPCLDLGIAQDKSNALINTLQSALSRCDVIVTTGGVSMGELDLLKPTIERSLNGTIHFGRVAMKPGKPTTFATISMNETNKAVFALPGNPASALVTFHLFVLPYVRKYSGYQGAQIGLPTIPIQISHQVKLDPRPEYHRVNVIIDNEGQLKATTSGGQRSSRVGSLRCNGFACLPASSDAKKVVESGEIVQVMLIDAITTRT